ncbi:MAG: ABC transporter ATP-binding protein, partial [Pseudomonadota bacterium]
MYRFFENLVDPFGPYKAETPPAELLPYLKSMWRPFRPWMPWIAASGLAVAVIEAGLIFYAGRIIDMMTNAGVEGFWQTHGLELTLVALFILVLRPLFFGLNHLFLEQTLASNLQDLVRWRAHRHMLGQSSNFFQNDFAGRLSNRVMQIGPAVEDSTYMLFEAVWYALAYVVAVSLVLADVDPLLVVPVAVWLVLYLWYVRFIARRVAVASEKTSDARSLATGRIVDSYTNIETVKLFADSAREENYARHALARHR